MRFLSPLPSLLAETKDHGAPGVFEAMEGTKGKGGHAGLRPFEMHNVLVTSGPDWIDEGNGLAVWK